MPNSASPFAIRVMLLRSPPVLAHNPADKTPVQRPVAPHPQFAALPRESLPKTERATTPFPQPRSLLATPTPNFSSPRKNSCLCPEPEGKQQLPVAICKQAAQPKAAAPQFGYQHAAPPPPPNNNGADLRPPPRPRLLAQHARDGGADLVTEPHLLPANCFALRATSPHGSRLFSARLLRLLAKHRKRSFESLRKPGERRKGGGEERWRDHRIAARRIPRTVWLRV